MRPLWGLDPSLRTTALTKMTEQPPSVSHKYSVSALEKERFWSREDPGESPGLHHTPEGAMCCKALVAFWSFLYSVSELRLIAGN